MESVRRDNIDQIIKKTVEGTVRELERAKLIKSDTITYFQKTEKLLYNYKNLIEAVKQKEEDIELLKKGSIQRKSKSIVMYSSNRGTSGVEQHVEIIEGYKASKERTERLLHKIERALKEIEDDPYYWIIQAKYFNRMSNADMEEKFKVTDRTIRRNKNRLINNLQVILFGADALE